MFNWMPGHIYILLTRSYQARFYSGLTRGNKSLWVVDLVCTSKLKTPVEIMISFSLRVYNSKTIALTALLDNAESCSMMTVCTFNYINMKYRVGA